MTVPMSVLKPTVGIPTVVASCLLWVLAFALPPPLVGLLAFVTGTAIVCLLAAGVGERLAVRLLTVSRPATPGEEEALAPLAARLAVLGIARVREVLVRGSVGRRTAQLVGDGLLVVTPWLVEAPARGWLSLEEAVALVVHADGRRRAVRPRAEVAALVLTLPVRAVVALGAGVANVVAGVPFLRFAWSIRAVVGVIAVAQQASGGRPLLGVLAGVIVALTYLVPAAARAQAVRVEASADAVVIGHGLGPVFAGMLRRYRLPATADRLRRLQKSGTTEQRPTDRPRLELVRG